MSSVVVAVVIAVVAATSACAPEPGERAGNPDVYRRISVSTDCETLRREFDRAMDRVETLPPDSPRRDEPMGYASTAMERMNELDCEQR